MIVQHDDNRFTMLKVYTDGRRIVAERGLTFTQCRDSKLFPLGTSLINRAILYTLTSCRNACSHSNLN